MNLYTERHGLRKPVIRSTIISGDMYVLLFDCCDKYKQNIAWKYPVECPDGRGCCGLHHGKLDTFLKFKIPNLYRDDVFDGAIATPRQQGYNGEYDEFDQFALLDYIEFFAQNLLDISMSTEHNFFGHDDMTFANTSEIFDDFRIEINNIFEMTGLLYVLTENKTVERIIDNSVLSPKIESTISSTNESELKKLLEEAIFRFRQPRMEEQKVAVEKLWDAFERMKTYYTTLNKKTSAEKIVSEISHQREEYKELFDLEFKTLTTIGNEFRIRHHETNKIDITEQCHYDYFFNRCLALIAIVVPYLN